MPKKLTNEEFMVRYPNFELASDYQGRRKPVDVQCKRCGRLKHYNKAAGIKEEIHCDICDRYLIYPPSHAVSGSSDVYTKRPDLIELFVDSEDAKKICTNSQNKALLKCPECGTIDWYTMANVSKQGLSCKSCSRGRSFPNRLMFNLLKLKLNEFIPEFHPKWGEDRFYDFMFSQEGVSYIVEMDGGFHYCDNNVRHVSHNEQIKIDNRKTRLAEEHNYRVIRIDCNYEHHDKFVYIKNNIINSELYNIIKFSNEDFDNANRISQKSDLINVCSSWDSGVQDVCELMKLYGLSYTTIIKKLKNGEKLGICSYVHSEQIIQRIKKGNMRSRIFHSTPVRCIETGEIFISMNDGQRKYHGSIERYLQGQTKHAGKLQDGTKLHWEVLDGYTSDVVKTQYTIQN